MQRLNMKYTCFTALNDVFREDFLQNPKTTFVKVKGTRFNSTKVAQLIL